MYCLLRRISALLGQLTDRLGGFEHLGLCVLVGEAEPHNPLLHGADYIDTGFRGAGGMLGKKIVCILTGNGLKDPDSAIKYSGSEVKKTSSELNDILKAMQI